VYVFIKHGCFIDRAGLIRVSGGSLAVGTHASVAALALLPKESKVSRPGKQGGR
jgi:hypothetical protein